MSVHPDVRAFWLAFTREHERGACWMYLGTDGQVRVGLGHVLEPVDRALELPWQGVHRMASHVGKGFVMQEPAEEHTSHVEHLLGAMPAQDLPAVQRFLSRLGERAGRILDAFLPAAAPPMETPAEVVLPGPTTEDQIRADWARVKDMEIGLAPTRYHVRGALTLPERTIEALAYERLATNAEVLAALLPDLDEHPLNVQLALHSLAWSMGAGIAGPEGVAIQDAVRMKDWKAAAKAVDRSTTRGDMHHRLFWALVPEDDEEKAQATAEAEAREVSA